MTYHQNLGYYLGFRITEEDYKTINGVEQCPEELAIEISPIPKSCASGQKFFADEVQTAYDLYVGIWFGYDHYMLGREVESIFGAIGCSVWDMAATPIGPAAPHSWLTSFFQEMTTCACAMQNILQMCGRWSAGGLGPNDVGPPNFAPRNAGGSNYSGLDAQGPVGPCPLSSGYAPPPPIIPDFTNGTITAAGGQCCTDPEDPYLAPNCGADPTCDPPPVKPCQITPCSVCPPAQTWTGANPWLPYLPQGPFIGWAPPKALLLNGMCCAGCDCDGDPMVDPADCQQQFEDLDAMLAAAHEAARVAALYIKTWKSANGAEICPAIQPLTNPPTSRLFDQDVLQPLLNSLEAAEKMLTHWLSEVFTPGYLPLKISLERANDYLLGLDISANLSMYTAAINDVLHNMCPNIPGKAKGCGPNYMVNIAGVAQATVPVNLQGPQYLSIALEDYTQSRPSSGLIGIAAEKTRECLLAYFGIASFVF